MEDIIHCTYQGNTQVEIAKEGCADTLHTEHDGKNRYFTPGDVLAGALGACTLSMMEALATRRGKSLAGAKITLKPVFAPHAAGLQKISLLITLPEGTDEAMRQVYLSAAQNCPVHKSLNPAIEFDIQLQ